MNKDTFPVLIKNNEKIYRIMNISIGKDNSFYFSFPNKDGYRLKTFNISQYTKEPYSKKSLNLNLVDFDCQMPKVSFHPKKHTVHIKSQKTNNLFDKDYELFNFNKDGYFECPMMQVSLPYEMDYFEEYNNTKYPVTCLIERRNRRKNMSIYIYIHSTEVIPPNVLNIKSKNPNILSATALINGNYTISFYSSCTVRQRNSNLLININTKHCSIISILEKNFNHKDDV